MRAKSTLKTGIILLCMTLMLAAACGKKVQDLSTAPDGVPYGVAVALPRETKNAENDSAVLKESAVVVSIPYNEQFYLGAELHQKEEVGDRISRLLEGQPAANRIVYIAAAPLADYGNVVQMLDTIRRQNVNTIGLLVERQKGNDAPRVFKVQITPEPAADEVLPLKPDPLTLRVSIGADDKVQLNESKGDTRDTADLWQNLARVLQQRPGHEKTVIIKARRSTRYGQVVLAIDEARGAGANPIILQLDDLYL